MGILDKFADVKQEFCESSTPGLGDKLFREQILNMILAKSRSASAFFVQQMSQAAFFLKSSKLSGKEPLGKNQTITPKGGLLPKEAIHPLND